MKTPRRYCEAVTVGVNTSLPGTQAVRVTLGRDTLSCGGLIRARLSHSHELTPW